MLVVRYQGTAQFDLCYLELHCYELEALTFPGADVLFCWGLLFVYTQLFYEETLFSFNYL